MLFHNGSEKLKCQKKPFIELHIQIVKQCTTLESNAHPKREIYHIHNSYN